MASGQGFLVPGFGSLDTSVDTNHFPSPRYSTTPLDGLSTLRTFFLTSRIVTDLLPSCRLGVPYYAWRITHAKHHASTGHMTQDQVFVPPTRSDRGLPPLDPTREDRLGSQVTEEVKKEMREALGDSPIGTIIGSASYLVRLFLIHFGKPYSYKPSAAWGMASVHR